ncbi:MAG: PIG-L family deacetylase [Mogibacterium sp.]|nr:PIG-L family deacetylase [Mogibacterium sp.]
MSLTKLALKIAAPVPKIESFTRYLFIGPHPDDIEIGCGATAAKLAAAGSQVTFLIVTDGRYGDGFSNGVKGEDLVSLRKQESAASAELLGVRDVRFMDLCDGGFYDYEDMVKGIAAIVGECRPDLIFAPDPYTERECHIDHLNTGRAAAHVAYLAPYPGIMEREGAASADVKGIAFYMTAKPNRFVKISGEMFERQNEALFGCHTSQFPPGSAEAKQLQMYLKLRSADFGLRNLCPHAEGFRVLGQTHMHCIPETV